MKTPKLPLQILNFLVSQSIVMFDLNNNDDGTF